jgi:hypothetical protein
MHHHDTMPTSGHASTSLLVWGGAPGNTSDAFEDRDTSAFTFSQSGDEPDPDEHFDR